MCCVMVLMVRKIEFRQICLNLEIKTNGSINKFNMDIWPSYNDLSYGYQKILTRVVDDAAETHHVPATFKPVSSWLFCWK